MMTNYAAEQNSASAPSIVHYASLQAWLRVSLDQPLIQKINGLMQRTNPFRLTIIQDVPCRLNLHLAGGTAWVWRIRILLLRALMPQV